MVDMSKLSSFGTTVPGVSSGVLPATNLGYDNSGSPYGTTPSYGTTGGTSTFGSSAGLQMPGEWDEASAYWRNLMNSGAGGTGGEKLDGGLIGGGVVPNQGGGGGGGGRIQTPSAWTTGLETLNPMAQTGMPVSADEWWGATQAVTDQKTKEAIQNAAEQAGLGGMRWSTPLGYTAQDLAGQYQNEANQSWADRLMQSEEAARQRQLEATGQLFQYGQGQYQMDKDAKARAAAAAAAARGASQWEQQFAFEKQKWADQMGLQGASNLAGIGSDRSGLGLNVANAMYNMGTGMQTSQQNAINASYNSPYMNYGQGYLASQPSGQQQTYQPSTGANVMGALSAMPWSDIVGGNSGNSGNYVGSSTYYNNPYNMSSNWTY